ncbi:glycosyltransferase, family 29 [Arcobacter venerupis]|uniref:Glycosyltransferase, family 29 n=2 Tax=Arcobacter venerupis TaxID=1054033 RepID=A0AAE7BCB0_9BACT|nr:glycosyltransferase, family 29 [Arcobacter venerupis]RWS48321.1 hypothetical protein CKA56_14820 [Arcobacter venerupis]
MEIVEINMKLLKVLVNKLLRKLTLKEDKFKEFFNNKSIAIIGNAQSLFDQELGIEIDSHDIVIRMNSGMIKEPKSQGNKTTIWASSFPLKESEVNEKFNPKYVFWITPKLSVKPIYSIYLHKKMFMLPFSIWEELYQELNQIRPTTGLSIIYFILEHCNAQKVDLYGFDFFETKSFYLEKIRTDTPHDFLKEKNFVSSLMKKYNYLQLREK